MSATAGSKTADSRIFKDSLFKSSKGSSSKSGLSEENRRSYVATEPLMQLVCSTQCIVALTFRPSGAFPPLVSGSYVQRISTTFPDLSFTMSVHVTKYPTVVEPLYLVTSGRISLVDLP
ncbi:MAG: hypothetical protein Ct9H90mP30_6290 [Actinomycetota bacterium]|nr:MAG: hypothetical protein Ct9H90mP30_6290 [Actinomycetota bacterium]